MTAERRCWRALIAVFSVLVISGAILGGSSTADAVGLVVVRVLTVAMGALIVVWVPRFGHIRRYYDALIAPLMAFGVSITILPIAAFAVDLTGASWPRVVWAYLIYVPELLAGIIILRLAMNGLPEDAPMSCPALVGTSDEPGGGDVGDG